MKSVIMEELSALLEIQRKFAAPYVPRQQGIVEEGHKEVSITITLLIHSLCHAFPQDWDEMAPVVEYLVTVTPYDNGLCSRDFECGWSLLGNLERSLLPFTVPNSLPEDPFLIQLIHGYSDLKLFFDRFEAAKAEKLDASMNASRHPRRIHEGDEVYRRKPSFARPHKGTFPLTSTGPCIVLKKFGEAHVILGDLVSKEKVDRGVPVPMDQIITYPQQKPVTFLREGELEDGSHGPRPDTEPDHNPRSWSQMIKGAPDDQDREDSDLVPGRTKWANLGPGAHILYRPGDERKSVRVGRILVNSVDSNQVQVHQFRGEWTGMTVTWTPLFITRDGALTTEILDLPAKISVLYPQIVRSTEIMRSGEICRAAASDLQRRGYTFDPGSHRGD